MGSVARDRFYDPDLALIHDEGFWHLAQAATAVLLDRIAPPGLVVDLGCGSGILAAALADAGFAVQGVDVSAAMLALARRRAPNAALTHASIYEAELPGGAVAVAAIGEVLNYEPAGPLEPLLRRVHDALAPSGLLLTDVAGPGRTAPSTHHAGEGWAMEVSGRADARTLTRHIVTTSASRRSEETHVLRLLGPGAVTSALHGAGFTAVRTMAAYADLALPPGLTAYAAT